jgi:methionyl-tRNA formyltransferase
MKIVFMGTPDFAVTILDGIVEKGFDVIAVITAPDKPAGRGRQLNQSAVKEYALNKELTIMQPTNLKDVTFISKLEALNADLFVVVAFRMLPEVVWAMPPKGTINLHGSLLPQYRGAAPINWAIINGETETGVTTFFIEKEIDTGKIIHSDRVVITENMIAGELHDLLAEKGKETMLRTIYNIENNTISPKDQDEYNLSELKKAPKIFKEDCLIGWKKKARENHNFVRGLSPYPAAWCRLEKNGAIYKCKLFNSKLTSEKVNTDASAISSGLESFLFPCVDFYLSIQEIQLEGKRRMTFKEFNTGNKIEDYQLLA